MKIAKAYEMLIAAQSGRGAAPVTRGVGTPAEVSGTTWLSTGIYHAVSAVSRLVDRVRSRGGFRA